MIAGCFRFFCSVYPKYPSIWVLHDPLLHGVGCSEGQRLACHIRPLLLPVSHRHTACEGEVLLTGLVCQIQVRQVSALMIICIRACVRACVRVSMCVLPARCC